MTFRCDLKTERLCLRRGRFSDHAPFAALNADPRVMEYFPATMSGSANNFRVKSSVVLW